MLFEDTQQPEPSERLGRRACRADVMAVNPGAKFMIENDVATAPISNRPRLEVDMIIIERSEQCGSGRHVGTIGRNPLCSGSGRVSALLPPPKPRRSLAGDGR
ncbi:hypothetical protein C5750_26250, partial [Phyllobacterium myrsinacearum]